MLPKEERLLANLFLNFIENKKKQMSTVNPNRLCFDEWENTIKDGANFVITCKSIDPENTNYFELLTTTSNFLYYKSEELDLEIPNDRVENGIIKIQNSYKIGVGKKCFYHNMESIWENGINSINFGNSITIITKEDEQNKKIKMNLKFALKGTLAERIYDGEFIKEPVKVKRLSFNGVELPFDNGTRLVDETFYGCLNTLSKIKNTLERFNIDKDLEMDSLGEKEQWKLNFLANAENFELKEIASIETPVRCIDIANIQLIVWLIPAESKVFAEDFFAKFYDVTIVGTTLALCL